MYLFLQTATAIALLLPIAAAAVFMARGISGRTMLGLDQESAIYAAGVILAAWTFAIVIYTMYTQGPGVMASIHLAMGALTLLHVLDTMREHVPIGSPWGYRGG